MQKNWKSYARRVTTALLSALLVTGSCPYAPLATADAVYTPPENVLDQSNFYITSYNYPTEEFLMDGDPDTCWEINKEHSSGLSNGNEFIYYCDYVIFNVGSYMDDVFLSNTTRKISPTEIVLTTANSGSFDAEAFPIAWELYGYNDEQSGSSWDDPYVEGGGEPTPIYDEDGNIIGYENTGGGYDPGLDPGYYGDMSEWNFINSGSIENAEPSTNYTFELYNNYTEYSKFLFTVTSFNGNTCQLAELHLRGSTNECYSLESENGFELDNDGNYLINNDTDWNKLADLIQTYSDESIWWNTKKFKLTDNISVNTIIGDEDHPFKSSFDGNGKTITFNYNGNNDTYIGAFRATDSCAVIKNLNVSGTVQSSSSNYVGGIVGHNKGTVMNCTNNISVSGGACTGGIVGYNYGGKIIKCVNNANITGSNQVGGIVGCDYSEFTMYTGSTAVIGCINNGTVSGTTVGGIIGCLHFGDNYWMGDGIKHHIVANVTSHNGIIGELSYENSNGDNRIDVRCNYTLDSYAQAAPDSWSFGGLYHGYGYSTVDLTAEFPLIQVDIADGIGQRAPVANVFYDEYTRFTTVEHPAYVGNGETVLLSLSYTGNDEPIGYKYTQGNNTGNFDSENNPYEYGYYNDSTSSDSYYYTEISEAVNDNVTFEPVFAAPQEYTITFDTNGGSAIAPITQGYGTAITAPANPTREGYIFAGWNPDIPTTMPDHDMTITANWTVNQYTITFDTNGGSTINSITQDYGTSVTAPANPTKTGHTFNGWDKTIPTTMPAEDMKITAQWAVDPHTITFMNDGEVFCTITGDFGTAVTAPANPTKTGYTFVGWNQEIPTTMPDHDMTITANWTVNSDRPHYSGL